MLAFFIYFNNEASSRNIPINIAGIPNIYEKSKPTVRYPADEIVLA